MTERTDDDPTGGREPAPTRVTSADVARIAGVSVSAVSLAFNNRPGIGEATRQRILDAAAELNWRPLRAARALKGAANDAIGLVIARPARTLGVEPFFAHILSGLQSRLSPEGIALQLLIVEDTAAEVATYRRWAAEHRVDGLVLLDLVVDDPRPAVVADLGIPAVMLGGHGADAPVSSVWVDDHAAMAHVLEYLAALGHTRIGHVSGVAEFQHTRRRLDAVAERSADLGVEVRSLPTDFTDAQGAAATRRLLMTRPRPTAIVFDSDVMAVAGLAVAAEMGVAVPGDLSVLSFDDSTLTAMTHPSVTALSRDTDDLGAATATELLRVVAEGGPPRQVQVATPELVVRGSTAPPAAG
ncbi:LacI family DNA-binding transcriptional regulator [Cellulomonas triticagri]|uniref:LacI family transcriptional regulator n=1 Tax=Cellulomonas triticagri TaxID=2483352 RepID=A0A3M2JLL1_9CELL|nr:LacI family DNA-binding transcriptional regulator [Cellulomonas triticagri]RMI12710.1 LacI family transcriptional regulator [Cellulomonas triticagri]